MNSDSQDSKSWPLVRPTDRGGFSPLVQKWMGERSAAFQQATQAKGKPVTYGSGRA